MWKVFLTGAGAIALLVAGSVAAILALTGDPGERPAQRPSQTAAPSTASPAAAPVPPSPAAGGMTYGSPPADPAPIGQPAPAAGTRPPPPPPGSWEAVPITSRAKSLGRLGGVVSAALRNMHDELRGCFTVDAQERFAGAQVATVKDAEPMDDAGPVVLVLQLEAGSGELRIVDAPLEARGGGSDPLVACAQSVLRGKVIKAPGVAPGARYRLLHSLMP
jgi:hypothetical protein